MLSSKIHSLSSLHNTLYSLHAHIGVATPYSAHISIISCGYDTKGGREQITIFEEHPSYQPACKAY